MSPPPPPPPPKALLFDIGGVCVLSPFQAILDYESSLHIPPGWINFAISSTKPHGAWHRMERGELVLGPEFYAAFKRDLSNEILWKEWCARGAKRRAAKGGEGKGGQKSGTGGGSGDGGDGAEHETKIPPVPDIDTEYLLDAILRISRNPDPHMYPALRRLKVSGRFMLAALSNTMALPEGHFAAQSESGEGVDDVRTVFEPFVSSAHTGVRKPEWGAYELALKMMNETRKGRGEEEVKAGEVLFLDDIGENLRVGREFGFRTLKVNLGNTQAAVKELERLLGMSLMEDGAKL